MTHECSIDRISQARTPESLQWKPAALSQSQPVRFDYSSRDHHTNLHLNSITQNRHHALILENPEMSLRLGIPRHASRRLLQSIRPQRAICLRCYSVSPAEQTNPRSYEKRNGQRLYIRHLRRLGTIPPPPARLLPPRTHQPRLPPHKLPHRLFPPLQHPPRPLLHLPQPPRPPLPPQPCQRKNPNSHSNHSKQP